jgi:hypothetical protein
MSVSRQPSLIDELQNFEPAALKHAEVQDKSVLPTKEDIDTERRVKGVLEGVESFNKTQLRQVSTDEKQVIPDKETIELERKEIQEAKSS